jgi:hypothetical protein
MMMFVKYDKFNDRKRKCLLTIASTILSAVMHTVFILEDEDEKSLSYKKVRKEFLPFMANNEMYKRHRYSPQYALVSRLSVEDLFYDPNRNYVDIFTSFYTWEFFALALHLQPYIESTRSTTEKCMGNRIKKDYQ